NVVQVYEVGRWEQQVYLAMEFVQGKTLGAWLKEQPRTWQSVLDVMLQAGRGLSAAHEADIVHGDFKPDNVLIDQNDHSRVVDCGLARAAPRSEPHPRASTSASGRRPTDSGATSRAAIPVVSDHEAAAADSNIPLPEPGRSHGGKLAG